MSQNTSTELRQHFQDIGASVWAVLAEQDPVCKVVLSHVERLPDEEYVLCLRDGDETFNLFPKVSADAVLFRTVRQLRDEGLLSDAGFAKVSEAIASEETLSVPLREALDWFPQAPRQRGTGALPELMAAYTWKLSGIDAPFSIRTRVDLQQAGDWFVRHHSKLSSTDRRTHAKGLVAAARKLSFASPSSVVPKEALAYAGGFPREGSEAYLLLQSTREGVGALLEPATRQKVAEAYAAAAEQLQQGRGTEDLADGIDEIDQMAGYDGQYGAHQIVFTPYGYDKTSSISVGSFSGREPVYTPTTHVFLDEVARLGEFDLTALKAHFTESQIDELRQDPVAVFKALPKPHQDLVAREIRAQVKNGYITPRES